MKKLNNNIAVILPNLKNGGAERSHIYIANEWVKAGCEVTFILMKYEGDLIKILDNKIKIINLDKNKIRNIIFPLSRIFYKFKYDVIFAPMWPITSISILSWYFSLKKGKLIIVDHNPIIKKWAEDFGINWLFVKASIKLTYKFSFGIISVSSGIKANIMEIINYDKNKLRVIFNPIKNDPSNYKKNIVEKKRLFGNSKYNIVTTGSLKKSKDYTTLIKSIHYLINKKMDLNLTIIGEGKEKIYIEQLIKKLNLKNNVTLLGYINDPFPWLINADAYVNSSLYDGLPLSLIEALICKIPIISTDCESGPREILQYGKYGKLVPIKDYKSFAIAIEDVLSKKIILEKISNEEMLKYNPEYISKQYLDFVYYNQN